jgi:hypothetical protein
MFQGKEMNSSALAQKIKDDLATVTVAFRL